MVYFRKKMKEKKNYPTVKQRMCECQTGAIIMRSGGGGWKIGRTKSKINAPPPPPPPPSLFSPAPLTFTWIYSFRNVRFFAVFLWNSTSTYVRKSHHFRKLRLRIVSTIKKAGGIFVSRDLHSLHVSWRSHDISFGLKMSVDLRVRFMECTHRSIWDEHDPSRPKRVKRNVFATEKH